MGNRVFVATETGSTEIDGELYSFHRGLTRVVEGHPLLKQCGGLFAPAEEHVTYSPEQATESPRSKPRGPAKASTAKDGAKTRNGDAEKPAE
jgi:hypothetical protein